MYKNSNCILIVHAVHLFVRGFVAERLYAVLLRIIYVVTPIHYNTISFIFTFLQPFGFCFAKDIPHFTLSACMNELWHYVQKGVFLYQSVIVFRR